MLFQEEAVVKIIYKTEGLDEIYRTETSIENIGDKQIRTTIAFKNGIRIMKTITDKYRGFRMEMLSVMFFGMALSGVFKGLTGSSMEMVGVGSVLSDMLGIIFLPIAMMVLAVVLKLWQVWNDLPAPIKHIIRIIVLLAGVLGGLLVFWGAVTLGVVGVKMALATLSPAFLIVTAAIAVVIAIIVVLYYIWTNNLFGIRDKTEAVVNWIRDKITTWINAIKDILGSVMQLVKDIWHGDWDAVKEDLIEIWNKIKEYMGRLKDWFFDIAKNIIDRFIEGIKSRAGAVADAFWNLLPDWMKNAIKGVGRFAKDILGAFGGIFGFQHGGIVTKPTLGLLGERGPEAVIPLNRYGEMGSSVRIDSPVINITSVVGSSSASAIVNEIIEKLGLRLSGVTI